MRKTFIQNTVALIFVACTALGTWWVAGATPPAQAQTESAVAAMLPDVVGFHTGVTLQEGFAKLKAYDAKAKVDIQSVTIPQISDKPLPYQLTLSEFGTDQSPEVVQIGITLPPNKQVVWKVGRQLHTLPPTEDMSRATLVDALRKKYGKEDYGNLNPSGANLVWLFDEQGKRETENKPPASPCSLAPVLVNTNGLGMAILNQPSPTFPQDSTGGWLRCKNMVFVKAFMQADSSRGAEYINFFTVTVGDGGLASRAADATVAFLTNAGRQQQKREEDKLKQQSAPKL